MEHERLRVTVRDRRPFHVGRGSFGESRSWNHASAALELRQKWEPDGSVDVCSITKSWTCETFTCALTARTLTPFLTAGSGSKQYISKKIGCERHKNISSDSKVTVLGKECESTITSGIFLLVCFCGGFLCSKRLNFP